MVLLPKSQILALAQKFGIALKMLLAVNILRESKNDVVVV